MAKLAIKIIVILLLVLSATALVLGVLLFQQREMLKGRTQKLETAIKQVAATVDQDDLSSTKVVIPDDQLRTFKAVPGGPPAMDVPLNNLVNRAQYQLIRFNNMHSELTDARMGFSNAVEALRAVSNELLAVQTTIKEHIATIDARNATISEKEVAVKNLEREKGELKANAETFQTQIDDLEAENRDLVDTNAVLIAKVQEMEKAVNPEMRRAAMPKGHMGIVAYVNADWNFIIVRMNPETVNKVMPDLELLVHRTDRLIGKVKVASVVDNLAIAEIISDWQQLPLETGDYVMY